MNPLSYIFSHKLDLAKDVFWGVKNHAFCDSQTIWNLYQHPYNDGYDGKIYHKPRGTNCNNKNYSIPTGIIWHCASRLLSDYYYTVEKRICDLLVSQNLTFFQGDILHRINCFASFVLGLPEPLIITATNIRERSFLSICHSQLPYVVKTAAVSLVSFYVMRRIILAVTDKTPPNSTEKKPERLHPVDLSIKSFAKTVALPLIGAALAIKLLPNKIYQIQLIQNFALSTLNI